MLKENVNLLDKLIASRNSLDTVSAYGIFLKNVHTKECYSSILLEDGKNVRLYHLFDGSGKSDITVALDDVLDNYVTTNKVY